MLEDYVLDKIHQYILQPKYITTIAKEMCASFNSRLNNDQELNILKKALNKVKKEIKNTLDAIKMGVITKSTKDLLIDLEDKKEKLIVDITKINNRKKKVLTEQECTDFLFSLTALDLTISDNRKLLIDRFVKRVELGNKKIRIYYNPSNKPYLYSNNEDEFDAREKSIFFFFFADDIFKLNRKYHHLLMV